MAEFLNGKAAAASIKDEIREKVERFKADGGKISLAVVIVGNDPASKIYVRNKQRACEYTGIGSVTYELPEDTTEEELLRLIGELNDTKSVTGILVQMPLPPQIREEAVINAIDPVKDVDGFHPLNIGKMFTGDDALISCTPAGIMELLRRNGIELEGKECVIVGRSNNVSKPLAILMLRENATVTICHSKTGDLEDICRKADILVTAIGRPNHFGREYIKKGAVVVDVGINRDAEGKLCGDVDFKNVEDRVSCITPVPGGVGPMTVAMLMKNCLEAAERQR